MKRIILERLVVFSIACLFLFTSASNESKEIQNIEDSLVSDIANLMEKYNYEKEDTIVFDLQYTQDNNRIYYDYDITSEEIKSLSITAHINVKFEDDLNSTYEFLNALSKKNISIYDNEIQDMVNNFISTGEEQEISKTVDNRNLIFIIRNSNFDEDDYELYFHIW